MERQKDGHCTYCMRGTKVPIMCTIIVARPQLYSCSSVCLSVWLSVCVFVSLTVSTITQNLKNYCSIHLKLENIVVYEKSSEEFDIGHCPIKVKGTA